MLVQEQQVHEGGVEEEGSMNDKVHYFVCVSLLCVRTCSRLVFHNIAAKLAKIPEVVVAYSRNGWMNKELTKDWVSRAWGLLAFNERTASLFNDDCDPFDESDLEEDEEELADNELAVKDSRLLPFSSLLFYLVITLCILSIYVK